MVGGLMNDIFYVVFVCVVVLYLVTRVVRDAWGAWSREDWVWVFVILSTSIAALISIAFDVVRLWGH